LDYQGHVIIMTLLFCVVKFILRYSFIQFSIGYLVGGKAQPVTIHNGRIVGSPLYWVALGIH
jgi:hypothetical protein